MSTSVRFSRLQAAITPSKSEVDAAFGRALAVCGSLNREFYPETSLTNERFKVVGSMATRTAIKPASDIDVIFHISLSTWYQYETHANNGQSALLQRVRAILLQTYPRSEIKGDGPVVNVQFTSGAWVEVVPALNWDSDYWVPQTRNGGSWETADYDPEHDMVVNSDTITKGQTSRLIRMVKMWKRSCSVPIRAFHINILAVRFLEQWPHVGKDAHWDDWMFRDFLEFILDKAGSVGKDAEGHLTCFGDAWKSKAQTAHSRAEVACDYESSSGHASAVVMWELIFGVNLG